MRSGFLGLYTLLHFNVIMTLMTLDIKQVWSRLEQEYAEQGEKLQKWGNLKMVRGLYVERFNGDPEEIERVRSYYKETIKRLFLEAERGMPNADENLKLHRRVFKICQELLQNKELSTTIQNS
jgi:hypothetical protein